MHRTHQSTTNRTPPILVIYNESPDWPQQDKDWTARINNILADALTEKDYTFKFVKVYDSLDVLNAYDPHEWLVWNWCEELAGQAWSDALIAADLGKRGFAYTGSPPESLSLSCDRLKIKEVLSEAGVPTLPARVFCAGEDTREWDMFPAIVKGAHQHGSFGIDNNAVVHDPTQLAARIAYIRQLLNDDSLVEPFLDTREFHVSVLGNGQPHALPPAEYDYSRFEDMHERLYMYRWKFDDESLGYRLMRAQALPPHVDTELQDRLRYVAESAYKVSGMRDYGRIDIRLKGDEPQVLDVNPNPDMDTTSAILASAGAVGMSYADLAERIVSYATLRMNGNGHSAHV